MKIPPPLLKPSPRSVFDLGGGGNEPNHGLLHVRRDGAYRFWRFDEHFALSQLKFRGIHVDRGHDNSNTARGVASPFRPRFGRNNCVSAIVQEQ